MIAVNPTSAIAVHSVHDLKIPCSKMAYDTFSGCRLMRDGFERRSIGSMLHLYWVALYLVLANIGFGHKGYFGEKLPIQVTA